ncbi:hypothetical protein DCAR_0933402 [Daucus carota subsp. sativus]|uniref:rRNA N-glycosylase n=1 Tax=Daucus carota subsp. sativus TaxID=79200 RepID=A0A175YDS3_DAUCS|nr:hypothetical protein DCAR_0933402 [Daucus carota subsp. sativus]
MANTTKHNEFSSEPLTLYLDNEDGDEYEEFIGSLIKKFPLSDVKRDFKSLDDVGFHEEFLDIDLKPKIEKCFESQLLGGKAPDTDMKRVRRTYKKDELTDKNGKADWLFQLRLKHDDRDLDILIKKNNLYLVGYKGKYKEKDGKVSAENWIVLDGKNHKKVAASVRLLTPESNLYENLIQRLDNFQGIAKREQGRNIKYAQEKLTELKLNIERYHSNPEENGDFKRVSTLLKMVPNEITREHVETELEGDDNKAARDFLNHLKKPQADHILAEKLIKKLQKIHDSPRKPFSQESLILWGKVFKKKVAILRSLTAGKMDTDGVKETENWREEHEALFKLKKMLKKNFDIVDGPPETNPTNDETREGFFSKKTKLKEQYHKAVNEEKQAKFYKELKEKYNVFNFMMQSVRADAEIKAVKDRLAEVKLNRLAFTEAVEYLTKSSFGENERETANHIIKLAIMICEAARFPHVKEHVSNNYLETTHKVTYCFFI